MRTATWENIGMNVNGTKDITAVLEKTGLNYDVVKKPIMLENGIVIPNKMATVNSETNKIYGVVSTKYEVVQNVDAFAFVDNVDDVEIIKAGETDTGMVYIIGKLPETTVLGDTFTPYLIFQNGHNGMYTVKTTICPLRIVCNNQFSYSFKNSRNTISIQHSRNYTMRIAEAEKLIRNTVKYMANFKDDAEHLAQLKIGNDNDVWNIINKFFELGEEATERQHNTAKGKASQLYTAYNADDNANFKGTAWGMLNAYTDYITHVDTKNTKNKNDNKFLSVTFNDKAINSFRTLVENSAK